MPSFVYNQGAFTLTNGAADNFNWIMAAIKARLIAATAVPDKNDSNLTAAYYAPIGSDQLLPGRGQATSPANYRVNFKATAVTFPLVPPGDTVGWCIIFQDLGGGTGRPLCAIAVAPTPTDGTDITIQFDPLAVFYLQQ